MDLSNHQIPTPKVLTRSITKSLSGHQFLLNANFSPIVNNPAWGDFHDIIGYNEYWIVITDEYKL